MKRATAELRDDTVLVTLLERIKSALHPELVYLLGSRAKGEATADSDYDFLVVVSHSEKPRYQRNQEAYLALCGSGVAKDVIVLTREEFESSQRAVSSLASMVLHEGVLLLDTGNPS